MTEEYRTIVEFYGSRTASRSGVPLINHINEGIALLDMMGASDLAKRGFCIHPIVQNDEDVDVSWSEALPLAEEYRYKANAYLCRPETDHINTPDQLRGVVGSMSVCCRNMLVADKVQNLKDFIIYHKDTHSRSEELTKYFNLWLLFLKSDLWIGSTET